MHPLRAFLADAAASMQEVLSQRGIETELPVETPPDPSMGDAGIPCFPLARQLRKAPSAIAQELAAAIGPRGWILEVRAVGPYVNFFLDRQRLAQEVLADPQAALQAPPKPGRILLEHTSANPNGPLHVGRARNPILGDTLARILRAAGHDVETQYYMDNLGRQVALLYHGHATLSEDELPPAQRDKTDHLLVRYYQAAHERMKADPADAQVVAGLVARLEEADQDLLGEVRGVYEACFAGMQESLRRLGITYDSIKDESDLVAQGHVEATVEGLRKSPRWGQEEDGANFLDMADELKGSKSTKFYFTRKDGSSVYATRDVAYHKWKAEQVGPGGRLVDVLGEDHRLQARQVGVALEELGHERPTVVFYAFVSLPEGKMSTRANRVVFLDDLLDEAVERAHQAVLERRGEDLEPGTLNEISEAVGIAAVRFNIARVQPEKPIKFRWEEALDFEGGAPYVLYAHTRAASLLRRAGQAGIVPAFHAEAIGGGEKQLAHAIARLVPVLEDAAQAFAPHQACSYMLELAAVFNEYYRDQPVLTCEDPATQAARLWCVQAAKAALRRGLDALGLPALESM